MAPPPRPAPGTDAVRVAERLRHDLGKAIRLSAPDVLEADAEDLRSRLRSDVCATRRGPAGPESAADVFARWRLEASGWLPTEGGLGARVAAIERLVGEIGALASALDTLDRTGLERLDRLTRDVARECRSLVDEARSRERKA